MVLRHGLAAAGLEWVIGTCDAAGCCCGGTGTTPRVLAKASQFAAGRGAGGGRRAAGDAGGEISAMGWVGSTAG